ncbi:MAG: helix-turn-helix transcriptional regulator [Clostridia bacterium]|nr:helix-turn-helix transcriptional regulator [Clostridia bacterium]
MGADNKAGTIKNVRKTKWASVLYWTVFYTYVFLVATKYFIYEDGTVGYDFSMLTMYQHVALVGSIIVGFLYLKKRDYTLLKRVLGGLAVVLLLLGALFSSVRSHIAYMICLAVLLGQLADLSLLTYIYEMNNAERLYGIVSCHLLVAAVSVFTCFYPRTSAAFYWVIFGLALVAFVACFVEKRSSAPEVSVREPFQKKLYVPLVLACVGGVSSVFSTIVIMEKMSYADPNCLYLFYGGASIGAVLYWVIYRFSPKPASVSLLAGFVCSTICIFTYFLSDGIAESFSAAFGGVTFNLSMMNLYYILCNIIKKYDDSRMLRLAPIAANFVGGSIGVAATVMLYFAGETAYKVVLSLCLVGDVVILATAGLWEKGLSTTAKQEEYVRFDTTLTRAQAYASVGLTEKETEVADLLLEGLSLREIASRLFISENTAKTHRASVYRKMQVSSREEFVEKMRFSVQ